MKILLGFLGSTQTCPRALRLARFLRQRGIEVELLCQSGGDRAVSVQRSSPPRRVLNAALILAGRSEAYCRQKYVLPDLDGFDAAVCFDLLLLPSLVKRLPAERIVLDAREYYPAQFEDRLLWRWLVSRLPVALLQAHLRTVGGFTTVSLGLCRRYGEVFGRKPTVIPSFPERLDTAPTSVGAVIRLVHHGNSNANRALPRMVEAVAARPERFTLDLYLIRTDHAPYEAVRKLAEQAPNVCLHEAVPFDALLATLARYDVGLCFLPDATFNLRHAMPNKLYEYVQARLAVIVSPLQEMAGYVSSQQVGFVTNGFEVGDLIATLDALTAGAVQTAKAAADVVAKTSHAELFGARFLAEIDRLAR